MSETTTEYPAIKVRASEMSKLADIKGHSMGTAVMLVFGSVILIAALLAWVRDVSIWGNVDLFFFIYWGGFLNASCFISYRIAFSLAKIAEINRQIEWANEPIREVTTEYIDGVDTSMLEFESAGTIATNTATVNTITNRKRDPKYIGDHILEGKYVDYLARRVLVHHDKFIRRDSTNAGAGWIDMLHDKAKMTTTQKKDHFNLWKGLLNKEGYMMGNEWTELGIQEFLEIKLPPPQND